MELRFTLRDSEIFQAVQYAALRHRRTQALVVGAALAYTALVTLIIGHPLGLVSVIPLLVITSGFAFFFNPYLVTKKLVSLGRKQQSWKFADLISADLGDGSTEFEWSFFDRAIEGSKWFFLFKRRNFFIFPKTQMNEASVNNFRELLQAKGKLSR